MLLCLHVLLPPIRYVASRAAADTATTFAFALPLDEFDEGCLPVPPHGSRLHALCFHANGWEPGEGAIAPKVVQEVKKNGGWDDVPARKNIQGINQRRGR